MVHRLKGRGTAVILCALLGLDAPSHAQDAGVVRVMNRISADSIGRQIGRLQTPGGHPSRVAYTPGNDSAVALVAREFVRLFGAAAVRLDTFFISSAAAPWSQRPLINVEASLAGSTKSNRQIVLGAHLDSYGGAMGDSVWKADWQTMRVPGADDNASGIAGMLEIARALAVDQYRPEVTIRFVAFNAEEAHPVHPIYIVGSEAWLQHARGRGENPTAMINLDMIAFNPLMSYCDVVADAQSTALGDLAHTMNDRYQLGLTMRPPPYSGGTGSDHRTFWWNGIPAVLLIENYPPWKDTTFFPRNWTYHTSFDSLSHLNLDLAGRITRLGAAMLMSLASPSAVTGVAPAPERLPAGFGLAAYPNPFNPATTVTYEMTRPGYIRITAYDALGRNVADLLHEDRPAGRGRVLWDAGALPSGAYVLRMVTGDGPQAIRVVLMK